MVTKIQKICGDIGLICNRENMNYFKKTSIGIIWVWLFVFALIPILLVLFTSFLTPNSDHMVSFPATFSNYFSVFNSAYAKIFLQSISIAFLCAVICLIIGYPFAFIVARTLPRIKAFLLLLIIIPFWTSSLIRTYAIVAILKTKGVLNTVLLSLGIIHHPLHLLYSYIAVLVGSSYDLLPFMILPLYANIEKLDSSLIEAARDLGANKFTTFIRIIIPQTLPGIIAGSILVFLPAMTMFYIPVLLGGAKNILLGNLIENEFLLVNNWPRGSAISIAVILLLCLFVFVYWKKRNKKDLGSGI